MPFFKVLILLRKNARSGPAAAQATGPIIRAIVSLIEHRDMPPLLAVSPIPGNLASAEPGLKRATAAVWINAI